MRTTASHHARSRRKLEISGQEWAMIRISPRATAVFVVVEGLALRVLWHVLASREEL